MSNLKNAIIKKIPYFGDIYQKLDALKNTCYEPGHYYSPIVSIENIKKYEQKIWHNDSNNNTETMPHCINFNTDNQLGLVQAFAENYYSDLPFKAHQNSQHRYFFNNDYYSYTDGIFLYSFIRHFQPNKIIEIGSGFSSALMLDVNQLYFDNQIELSFIEPYTDRLFSLMSEQDKQQAKVITKPIQDVDLDIFKNLEANDILFIDSTHVVKTGSDVNFILFEILPILKSGVLIHFHDIFYPFEYPKAWVYKGRNWNENYFIRAFLMYNTEFKIVSFSDYLHKKHNNCFSSMPLTYKNTGGNLWLCKK